MKQEVERITGQIANMVFKEMLFKKSFGSRYTNRFENEHIRMIKQLAEVSGP